MTTRMLIDARHPEETRVAVAKGNRIEEFDFESEEHKQLKGNIYLAKVTRVEPSLQAAFVDFGGNRHGFLAFSEIHPDYYQIPKEDRDALLREEAQHAAEEEALRAREDAEEDDEDDRGHEPDIDVESTERLDTDGGAELLDAAEDHPHDDEHDHEHDAPPAPKPSSNNGGEGDAVEALRKRRMALRRRYKIQDVIRRRQVLLVQVVKEERGNKGAALTTYLSLAGRYCVLMPNTAHGGGISRKISNAADRKRLKTIMAELQLPATMGCIVRTAGLQRTKAEIKRDFDYLARLWDEIRDRTLHSSAPALIHEDSSLIKRAIRDIYNKDIDEVIVEGEDGYRAARSFMKLLMPSHARKVAAYVDAVPLYQRFGVEDQLAAMYQPVVQLKSGGYLVINPTEALVSIDINSGRSTREHNIEGTATATNLEAAHEIARQLRLRDMAGLVVIDFIDMENNSNIRKVEKAMKEALRNDRARIQIGRISAFGLMEMSRQRLRTGVLEASTRQCPHCEGTGLVRTASSAGLSALRMLEEEAARGRGSQLRLRASQEAAIYVLNRKRGELGEIEDRYGVHIDVVPERELEGARMAVEVGGPPPEHAPKLPPPVIEPEEDDAIVDEFEDEDEEIAEAAQTPRRDDGRERDEEGGERRRRRRRRRRGGRRDEQGDAEPLAAGEDDEGAEPVEGEPESEGEAGVAAEAGESASEENGARRRGRRGRRGGRRRDQEAGAAVAIEGETGVEPVAETQAEAVEAPSIGKPVDEPAGEPVAAAEREAPRTRRRPRARAVEGEAGEAAEAAPKRSRRSKAAVDAEANGETSEAPARKPRSRRAKAAPEEVEPVAKESVTSEPVTPEPVAPEPVAPQPVASFDGGNGAAPEAIAVEDEEPAPESDGPPRRGWWQRTFGA
ncbi:MAG: Rne/Rng family ribonuclease [Sphingomonadaceae bacterium]|nr:Rne/Rng family ribonuclease [Sphingomonadaceae bacterium]